MVVPRAFDTPVSARVLLERVFWPLYPLGGRTDLAARPECSEIPANDSGLSDLIDEVAECFKLIAPENLGLPSEALDDTDASVLRLGAALTRQRRDRLLAARTLGRSRTPLLALIATHGTLYVSRCLVNNHQGQWVPRDPLWESTVRLQTLGRDIELCVFQWWVEALSDEEIDSRPLGDRYRASLRVSCRGRVSGVDR